MHLGGAFRRGYARPRQWISAMAHNRRRQGPPVGGEAHGEDAGGVPTRRDRKGPRIHGYRRHRGAWRRQDHPARRHPPHLSRQGSPPAARGAYPRATTSPVSRSACSSTPALWERSNDEAARGNRPLRKNSNRPFARVSLTPRGYVPGARQSCPLLLLFQQSACRTWPESPDHWFSVFRPPKTL
jgi:hypothetical protein